MDNIHKALFISLLGSVGLSEKEVAQISAEENFDYIKLYFESNTIEVRHVEHRSEDWYYKEYILKFPKGGFTKDLAWCLYNRDFDNCTDKFSWSYYDQETKYGHERYEEEAMSGWTNGKE